MASDELAPRSRRAILTAAAGAAGALAAGALVPASVAAAGSLALEIDNPVTSTTSLSTSGAGQTAFVGSAKGANFGYGLEGNAPGGGVNTAPGGAGVFGWSTAMPNWTPAFTPGDTAMTGVFGYAPAGDLDVAIGTGVWGDSGDTGVLGTGSTGVEGYGYWGVLGNANGNTGSIGVHAVAPDSATALYVSGKAHFSRSGRKAVARYATSVVVALAGTTASSKVFAVLATNASGRYIRAVVPYSGGFRVYFNAALATSAVVSWFVLD